MRNFPFSKDSLIKQNIKKRSKKKSPWKKILFFFILCPLFALLYFHFITPLDKKFGQKTENSHPIKPSWELTLKSNSQVTDKERIISKLPKIIHDAKTTQEVAEKIQKYFSFAKTTILQTAPEKLIIHIEDRVPEFSTLADKQRLVSIDHEIYGELSSTYKNLPRLENILNKGRKTYTFSENASLVLEEEEKERLREAQMILRLAEQNTLDLKEITFVEYRGFKLNFRQDKTEVFLGRKPFEKKFLKLLQIKKQFKNEDGATRRIELDYDGKAFIKTLKTGDDVDS
jgi:hypothetical protein